MLLPGGCNYSYTYKSDIINIKMEQSFNQLKEENNELKRALSILLNKPLIKQFNEAMDRINSGEYVTEEEFFKNSHQAAA